MGKEAIQETQRTQVEAPQDTDSDLHFKAHFGSNDRLLAIRLEDPDRTPPSKVEQW
jgi:hypothetical protein